MRLLFLFLRPSRRQKELKKITLWLETNLTWLPHTCLSLASLSLASMFNFSYSENHVFFATGIGFWWNEAKNSCHQEKKEKLLADFDTHCTSRYNNIYKDNLFLFQEEISYQREELSNSKIRNCQRALSLTPDPQFQSKNQSWKLCTKFLDKGQNVSRFGLPNQTIKFWHIFYWYFGTWFICFIC